MKSGADAVCEVVSLFELTELDGIEDNAVELDVEMLDSAVVLVAWTPCAGFG